MDAKIQIIKEISKLFLNLNKEITYRKKVKSGEWRTSRDIKTKNLRESLLEGFCGAYETRTRDLLRDRQAF
jgi:hypothetical protein|uniref:hypothetical protein n=1 Tax=Prevotella sp. TaxID=59823 RepID=UPI003FEF676B